MILLSDFTWSEIPKLFQKIVKNQIEAEKPTQIVYGTVATDYRSGKVTVRIDQKRVLPEEMLIFSTVYGRKTPKQGEKVILIRQRGGQSFLVAGGVEDDTH